ncbi:SIMPL domain-containing protein [Patescibacteria group bacterium]|nr:SIMPL domain-containing protein [Patescibacteria group bacterium]
MKKDPFKLAATALMSLLSLAIIISIFNPPEFKFDVNSTTHPDAKTITVSGEGTVVAKPDVAEITVSVVTNAKTVDEVVSDNTEKMNGIIDKMKELGIDEMDMKTTGYYLYPQYDYPERLSPVVTGYRLEQDLGLTIRDLDLVDNVIDWSTELGANNVYGLNFTLDDDTEVMKEAREIAFGAAKEKAEQMAAAAGVKLGDVYSFYEGYGYEPMPYYAEAGYGRGGGGDLATSIESGSQEHTVTVNITYEIE